MTERLPGLAASLHQVSSMPARCERLGIRRHTGYPGVRRATAPGLAGLQEQSRAPHRCPHRMSEAVEAVLLEATQAHPHGGPRPIRPCLARHRPPMPSGRRTSTARFAPALAATAPP